jgi:hypothetical protein
MTLILMHTKYVYTEKGFRGKISFDAQNGKYASQLSCDASPDAYLPLHGKLKTQNYVDFKHINLIM